MDPQGHRTLLGAVIAARQQSQAEAVREFNAYGQRHDKDATLSGRTLYRWLQGMVKTSPLAAQRRVAEQLWGFPMDELLAEPPPEALLRLQLTRGARQEPARGGDPAALTLERRVMMAARRASRFTADAETGHIGPETLDELRDYVGHLAADYLREPVTVILPRLAEAQDEVFNNLEQRQRPAYAMDLYLLGGVIAALLAKASQDLGRPREAMTQARAAYVCADNAGHRSLKAWSRGLQSLIAYWTGQTADAARYASLGAQELGDGTGTAAAWLPSLEARAWAIAGNEEAAAAAVARATAARNLTADDDLDGIGGLFSFPLAKQRYYAAGALVQLPGHRDQAAEEATAALELYTSGASVSYSDQAGAHAELALARVHAGELDGALATMRPVLDLPPERRITGIVQSASRVHAAAINLGSSSPAARTLTGEIEAFTRLAAGDVTA